MARFDNGKSKLAQKNSQLEKILYVVHIICSRVN